MVLSGAKLFFEDSPADAAKSWEAESRRNQETHDKASGWGEKESSREDFPRPGDCTRLGSIPNTPVQYLENAADHGSPFADHQL
jgi:hypothetical protein